MNTKRNCFILAMGVGLVLPGCGTMPLSGDRAQSMSNYELCRVVYKPLWSDAAKGQAAAVLKYRQEDCKDYIALMQAQDQQSLQLIGLGAGMIQASQPPPPPRPVNCYKNIFGGYTCQ